MPLIVDGNNLLHAPMPPALAGLDEARLCRLLTRSAWRGQRMVVVCDGGPRGLGEDQDGVELIFAGRGQSADDVILKLIEADTAPRRLTVVSTDREIRKAARRRRAKAVTSEAFIGELLRAAARGGENQDSGAKPAGGLTEGEVRRWMEEFDVDEELQKRAEERGPWYLDPGNREELLE